MPQGKCPETSTDLPRQISERLDQGFHMMVPRLQLSMSIQTDISTLCQGSCICPNANMPGHPPTFWLQMLQAQCAKHTRPS